MQSYKIKDGWLWYCEYGTEGDHVRVIKRELVE